MWQSADPVLNKYLPNAPTKPEDIVKLLSPTVQQSLAQFNLPGIGGVFNSMSLGMYAYANNNPNRYVDPDGRSPLDSIAVRLAKGAAEGIEGLSNLIARRHWRKGEERAMKDMTEIGPNGGKVCKDCGGEFDKLEIDHADKKWVETQHEILDNPENFTRPQVRDLYGKGIKPRCVACNRADNQFSAIGGGGGVAATDTLGPGPSWSDVGNTVEEIFISSGDSGGCSGGRCSSEMNFQ